MLDTDPKTKLSRLSAPTTCIVCSIGIYSDGRLVGVEGSHFVQIHGDSVGMNRPGGGLLDSFAERDMPGYAKLSFLW